MWKVPLFDLNYDDREKRAVNDVDKKGGQLPLFFVLDTMIPVMYT